MKIKIRQESASDFVAVDNLIKAAFKNAPHADGDEHNLVKRIRETEAYLPELSLVAENNGVVVGHIILSKIHIKGNEGQAFDSLALAPVSVHPEHQKQGLGKMLIRKSHELASKMGFNSIILLGHPDYYPQFGYKPASLWNIKAPFDVPDNAFMAIELKQDALCNVSGVVVYPDSFGIG
jgi:predicted N-acetyltransferase YhbS